MNPTLDTFLHPPLSPPHTPTTAGPGHLPTCTRPLVGAASRLLSLQILSPQATWVDFYCLQNRPQINCVENMRTTSPYPHLLPPTPCTYPLPTSSTPCPRHLPLTHTLPLCPSLHALVPIPHCMYPITQSPYPIPLPLITYPITQSPYPIPHTTYHIPHVPYPMSNL